MFKTKADDSIEQARPAAPPSTASAADGDREGRCAAVVLGLDSHGLAIARALATDGVEVFALERDLSLPGVATRFVQDVMLVQGFEAEYLMPALRDFRHRLRHVTNVALLAVNDRQVEVIGRNVDVLRSMYRIAWADCVESVLELQRKDSLQRISERQGLNYPRSLMFDKQVPAQAAASFRFPVIIKPVRPLSSFKTLLANDVDQLGLLLARHEHDLPILCQEYVGGDDRQIYFGALMLDKGRVLHGMVGRKIASYPPARGQTTIGETVDEPEVLRLTERFFAGTAISGPVSLELKRDAAGHWWVIEPTVGRTDFWAALCIAAGFNQPVMEYELAMRLPVTRPGPTVHAIWYDTERDPTAWLRQCWQTRSMQPLAKAQVFPYAGRHDPMPLARALRNLVRKAGQSVAHALRGRALQAIGAMTLVLPP